MSLRRTLSRPVTWVLVAGATALLVLVVGPFVYTNFIAEDAADELEFLDQPGTGGTATTTGPGTGDGEAVALEGDWTVTTGSQAGYRVREILSGQDVEAAGYTSDVSGSLAIEGDEVTEADFTVDMTTVTSGNDRRDGQYRGRIMDVATHPTATFTLTEPVSFDSVADGGEAVTLTVTGDFTIRGRTLSRTFDLQALRQGNTLQALGKIPVHFPDFDIPNPSFGIAKVGDDGEIDFRLVFAKA